MADSFNHSAVDIQLVKQAYTTAKYDFHLQPTSTYNFLLLLRHSVSFTGLWKCNFVAIHIFTLNCIILG
jgi:hypothetical protein